MTDETQQGQNGDNGVAPKQIEFQYNALGQFTSVARYDFVGVGPMVDIATAAYSYDGGNRMTSLAYTGNSGQNSIDSFAFTLDNADRITARTSSVDGTVNYGYDVTNQVTSASYTGGSGEPANESYSYSKNGNRTNTGYSTGTNNQLLSDGTFTYQYDGEGNRTVRTRISGDYATDYKTVYGWDYRDRLTDVSYYDNNGVLTKHVHYVYDSFDHEIGKQVDDTGGGSYDRSEWYVLDVVAQPPSAGVPSTSLADPLLEFDQNGNLQYRYLNGPTPAGVDAVMGEEAISTQGQAGTDYWPLFDQVNTPHEVVNNASSTVDHIITNTFGVVTSESNTSIHHWAGFEGGHFDPDTALTNDDHRWYDPVVGRWMSEDPIGFGGGDANVARYVGNGPASKLDPVGEEEEEVGEWGGTKSRSTSNVTGRPTWSPINIFKRYFVKTPDSKNQNVAFNANWHPGQYWGQFQHWNQHRPGPHPLRSFINGPHPVWNRIENRPIFTGDPLPILGPLADYLWTSPGSGGGIPDKLGWDPNDPGILGLKKEIKLPLGK